MKREVRRGGMSCEVLPVRERRYVRERDNL